MAQMAMMRVMQETRMEREGRWPSEGSMCTGVGGARAFLGLYARVRNGWITDNSDQIPGGEERNDNAETLRPQRFAEKKFR